VLDVRVAHHNLAASPAPQARERRLRPRRARATFDVTIHAHLPSRSFPGRNAHSRASVFMRMNIYDRHVVKHVLISNIKRFPRIPALPCERMHGVLHKIFPQGPHPSPNAGERPSRAGKGWRRSVRKRTFFAFPTTRQEETHDAGAQDASQNLTHLPHSHLRPGAGAGRSARRHPGKPSGRCDPHVTRSSSAQACAPETAGFNSREPMLSGDICCGAEVEVSPGERSAVWIQLTEGKGYAVQGPREGTLCRARHNVSISAICTPAALWP